MKITRILNKFRRVRPRRKIHGTKLEQTRELAHAAARTAEAQARRTAQKVGASAAVAARSFGALPRTKKIAVYAALAVLAAIVGVAAFNGWAADYTKTERALPLSDGARAELAARLDKIYAVQRALSLKPLPYAINPVALDVRAGSAILIDASNGCVLYEKNADEPIPPASLTKLMVMYIVHKEVAAGTVSLDDIVPLPERSWAVNLPADASLMHLGQGQVVTLRELMEGLAVASGNDAAIAVAYYISKNQPNFVARMNAECEAMGLAHTHFVEPSGYDERNMTTARDFATFLRIYLNEFPESLAEFHSLKTLRYPLQKNLPAWQQGYGDSRAVTQKNTNPLLGTLYGVDGIKTGFIYESGFNLALTAKRGGQRFISLTLKGPGTTTAQGNAGRVHDHTELIEWAFASFADYDPAEHVKLEFPVPVPGAQKKDGKFVTLVPAWTNTIAVPHIRPGSAQGNADAVRAVVSVPAYILNETAAGDSYGQIQYMLDGVVLETVPLVADRTMTPAGAAGRFWGELAARRIR